MSTRWDTTQVANGFEAYDDLPECTLGYPFAFRVLRLGDPDVRVVLDFGCGPGKVAERIVNRYATRVVAVDASPAMLTIATGYRADPRIDYRLVSDATMPFLNDGTIDAAMSCYVFINIGSLEVIHTIVREVYRVLRPGARYAVLDTNPDTTGVEFATFRSGDPGRRYAQGEQRRVLLRHSDGGELTLLDYHWPKEVYREILADVGFSSIDMHEPVLVNASDINEISTERAWRNETGKPPFLITVGEK
jgi:ubiquinone/menaquinone biosynthesis C-methylase UbiE